MGRPVSMTLCHMCAAMLVAPPAVCVDTAVWCLRHTSISSQGEWTPAGWTCVFWAVCCTNAVDVIDELVRRGGAPTSTPSISIFAHRCTMRRSGEHGCCQATRASWCRCECSGRGALQARAPPHSHSRAAHRIHLVLLLLGRTNARRTVWAPSACCAWRCHRDLGVPDGEGARAPPLVDGAHVRASVPVRHLLARTCVHAAVRARWQVGRARPRRVRG